MEKRKRVLVADSRETFRKGLCAIFAEEPGGAQVAEAATGEEFLHLLKHYSFDLVIVHQSLITESKDFGSLLKGDLVILATNPDLNMLSFARSVGACAYLQENIPGSFLRQILNFPPGIFLNDQAIASYVSEYLAHHILFAVSNEDLTDREREIFHLLIRGFSNRGIAQQVNIKESTVKTYVKHIYESLRVNRRLLRIISQLNQEEEP